MLAHAHKVGSDGDCIYTPQPNDSDIETANSSQISNQTIHENDEFDLEACPSPVKDFAEILEIDSSDKEAPLNVFLRALYRLDALDRRYSNII